MQKYTITDFNRNFPTDDACLEWLKNRLYPNGIFCKKCGRITKHHRVASRPSYSCDFCGHHVHPTARTIFHKSATPLRLWFHAIYLMASTRCGISAKQIQRETGVTYKTAWRMFHRIREALSESHDPFTGNVEVDDAYMGGKRPGKRGRGAAGKTPIIGAVERDGKLAVVKAPDVKTKTVRPFVLLHIDPDATIHTDELGSYNFISRLGYAHKRVHHGLQIWVVGDSHTNTIEGFWSLLKRGVDGVYHSISPQHLQGYVNEYVFRYNHREDDDPMFTTMLRHVSRAPGDGLPS